MSEAVQVSLIVGGMAMLSTLGLAVVTGIITRIGRNADWKRQDEVAAKAEALRLAEKSRQEEVAKKAEELRLAAERRQEEVARKAEEAAGLLLAANERVAAQTEHAATETNGRLDQIHTLVNSNMTTAMDSELSALTAQSVLMREVMALNEQAGRKRTPEAVGALAATEAKIGDLKATLTDRLTATKRADAQLPGKDHHAVEPVDRPASSI